MRLVHGFKTLLVSAVLTLVCANVCTADMSALPSGHIAACDYLVRDPVPVLEDSLLLEHRVIATCLEALCGLGTNGKCSQVCVICAIEGLELTSSVTAAPATHMHGESGLEWPDATQINLVVGTDYHRLLGWNLCDRANKHGLTAVDPTEWLAWPLYHHENPPGYLNGPVFGKAIGSRSY